MTMLKKDYDFNEVEIIKKENKRVYNSYIRELDRLQTNLGAEINASKDFTDNHKFNHIRTRLWEKNQTKNK